MKINGHACGQRDPKMEIYYILYIHIAPVLFKTFCIELASFKERFALLVSQLKIVDYENNILSSFGRILVVSVV